MTGWDADPDETPTQRIARHRQVPADWTPRRNLTRRLTMYASAVVVGGILVCAGFAGAIGQADPVPAAEQPRPLPTPQTRTETRTVEVPGDTVTVTGPVVTQRIQVTTTRTVDRTSTVTETVTVMATMTETLPPTTVTITETVTAAPTVEPTPEPPG